MRIGYGDSGWCRVDTEDLPGPLYVRLQPEGERLAITELYLDGRGQRLTPQQVRTLPLAALESLILADDGDADIRDRLNLAGPDLSRLASHYATTYEKGGHWVADSMAAQRPDSAVPQAPMGPDPKRQRESTAAKLSAPEDGLTDEFLRQVADAYNAAISRRKPPAKTLSAQAGVSPRSVHRWIYTARQRGLLGPATSRGRIV